MDTPRSFLEYAFKYSGEACLEWPFALQGNGYSKVGYEGRVQTGHRVVCLVVHGSCPSGYEAAHRCGNRRCLNPGHIRWASGTENQADRRLHGTELKGSKNPAAKLSETAVRDIRDRRGKARQVDLAAEYGVTQALISKIQRGHVWTA